MTARVKTLVSATAPAGKGSASVSGTNVTFNPGGDFDHLAAGATETVVVSYVVRDENNATSTSTLTITGTGTNDAPVAVADTGATTENANVTVNVRGNDTDVDDGATLTLVSAGQGGTPLDVPSYAPAISPDGRFVAFVGGRDNLVRDLTAQVTT